MSAWSQPGTADKRVLQKNTKKLEINVNKRKRSEQEETKRKRSACGEQTTCSPKKIKFRKKQKENESFASDWRLR